MIKNLDSLMEKFDELELLLTDYTEVTNQLCGADYEETEETGRLIESRQALIEQMKTLDPQISGLINSQSKKESELIRKMLKGENIFGGFSEEENLLYSKILNLKSLQGEILQKDKVNNSRFMKKYEEIKNALMELKDDKKKIDFYNQSKISGKGLVLNSNG